MLVQTSSKRNLDMLLQSYVVVLRPRLVTPVSLAGYMSTFVPNEYNRILLNLLEHKLKSF